MIETVIELVQFALAAVRKISHAQALATAADAVEAIRQVYKAVDAAVAGNVTPEEARTAIAQLLADLKANDAAADAALAVKFPA